MKTKTLLSFFIFCLITASSFAQTVSKDYWDGQLYLKLKDGVTATLPDYDATHPVPYPETFSILMNRFEIYSIRKAFPRIKSAKLERCYKILFRQKDQIEDLIKAFGEIGIVEYAEKIPVRRISLAPNDPLIGNQYALGKINAYNAWNLSTGRSSVKVAIVDDEVRLDHQDLSANRWINPGEIPGNNMDDDGNGYVDDINGYDVADFDGDPKPPATATNSFQTHGTHCAGIADAVSNNTTGIASIGYGLSLMGVKCNPDTITNPTVIYYAMEGVQYAVDAHADVISMSWGGDGYSLSEQFFFDYGWDQGIIFVAAAGNDGTNQVFYPAGYNHIVSVGSTTSTDALSGFSNFGPWISVMAPGSSIYSTLAGSNIAYGSQSGTSMACPMVAGLCGLIKSYDTLLTNAQVVSCLKSSCDNIDAQNPGKIGQLGSGRVNALAALQCADVAAIPVAQFSSINTTSCNGLVSFTDESTSHPDEWHWYFGDGDSSHVQNPTHQYRTSGPFTVTLVASNANGDNTSVQNNFVTVSLPASPAVTDSSVCTSGTVPLSAVGADFIRWYDAPVGGNLVATGGSFITPVLTGSTTYYVEGDVNSAVQFTAEPDSALGGGNFFTGANYHNISFDCYAPATLISVKVYAQGAGDRTIELLRHSEVINSVTVNIPDGESRVTLNFNLPVDHELELACEGTVNLYRNNAGISFPYTIPGLIKLTGTNAGTNFYYYFYDWEIQGPPCTSARVPVIATVHSGPTAAFNSDVVVTDVSFMDNTPGSVSWSWDFDDPASGLNDTSTSQNPTHQFSGLGGYRVCLSATDANGCTDTRCDSVHITAPVGISPIKSDAVVMVYPNPANDQLSVNFSSAQSEKKWSLKLTDVLGKTIEEKIVEKVSASSKYNFDLSHVSSGVYSLTLQSEDQTIVKKIIKK